ncbi:F-box domain-containing protein [Heracleum sosnowskyi]|uniref:F-box domain-containing protein n=1 Tax=Heracleum sosnowskyi TaxID=360622 RepID=A0AAD8I9P6_9APIA|nr:F-box domain-containing protein [Heracleum sosnowskyi]
MTGDVERGLMDCGGIVAGPVSKRQRVEFRGSGEDKISNLPGELITRILLLLPTHDVARTSILSKFWRNIWCMHPFLALDTQFFLQLASKIEKCTFRSEFTKVFNMILSSHTGPIFYFYLYITPAIRYCYHSWINQLSGKGLRTVNFLFEEKGATELSPALFGFPELTMLRLFNMAVAPSFKSGSFTSLTIVQLVNTSIIHDMTFGKQLKYLHLQCCEGIERLARQFRKGNNLQGLFIAKSTKFEWQWLQCTRKLRYLGLVFTAANSEIRKVHDLIKLLGETPTLSRLILDGPTLKVLGPPPLNVSRPTAKAVNLRSLTLFWLKSHELCQFSRVAYLIRSFPHLQDLCIQLELDQVKSLSPTELTTEQYLGSLDWKDMFLDQLQTVKIKGAVDSRYVLCFIKHLLASSPSLKGISVFCSTKSTDTKEKLRIEQELQQFPRLSLDAQIIWC